MMIAQPSSCSTIRAFSPHQSIPIQCRPGSGYAGGSDGADPTHTEPMISWSAPHPGIYGDSERGEDRAVMAGRTGLGGGGRAAFGGGGRAVVSGTSGGVGPPNDVDIYHTSEAQTQDWDTAVISQHGVDRRERNNTISDRCTSQ